MDGMQMRVMQVMSMMLQPIWQQVMGHQQSISNLQECLTQVQDTMEGLQTWFMENGDEGSSQGSNLAMSQGGTQEAMMMTHDEFVQIDPNSQMGCNWPNDDDAHGGPQGTPIHGKKIPWDGGVKKAPHHGPFTPMGGHHQIPPSMVDPMTPINQRVLNSN